MRLEARQAHQRNEHIMSNETTADHGYVTAYAAGGGSVRHIVQVTGTYYGAYAAAAVCGVSPRIRWGNTRWMVTDERDNYPTPAAAVADSRNVCKRCAAAAAKTAPAIAAAPAPVYVRADEVTPGTPVIGYTGPDPVVMIEAVEPAARPGVGLITWKTASGATFTEEMESRYLIPTAPAAANTPRPSTTEVHGAVITLDHLPVWQGHNTLEGLHKLQGQSADYALQHGGYAIVEDPALVRGYMDYMTIRDRRGYGVNGHLVRSIEALQYVSLQDGGALANDPLFAEDVAAPQLRAIRMMFNYSDGALSNLNGPFEDWVSTIAARFGLNPDTL